MKAYELLIELADVKPEVWRRLVVPAETNFKRLRNTIQFAVGWQDAHLYSFEIPQGQGYRVEIAGEDEMYDEHVASQAELAGKPIDPNDRFALRRREYLLKTKMKKARTTKLPKWMEQGSQVLYIYDYGDNWRHLITVERVIDDYPNGYPVRSGACPPEDVGGASGYKEFLKSFRDLGHDEHRETKD